MRPSSMFRGPLQNPICVLPSAVLSAKADIQADPAVVKAGVAGERGQIHTRVIHGTVGVGCLLEAEHGAVELGGDLDVVHDDVDVGDGLNISSRVEVGHYSCPKGCSPGSNLKDHDAINVCHLL